MPIERASSPGESSRAFRIITDAGEGLEVSPADRVWLLRAVEREGEPRELVAQTLVNRWAWARADGLNTWPLERMVRAYSQPVNPAWYPGGDKHLEALEDARTLARKKKWTDAKLAARLRSLELAAIARRDDHSTRIDFSPKTLEAVGRALEGPITLPAGAVEFAAPNDQRRAKFAVLFPGVRGSTNEIYGNKSGSSRGSLYSVPRPTAPFQPRPKPGAPRHRVARLLDVGAPHAAVGALILFALPWVGRAMKARARRRR